MKTYHRLGLVGLALLTLTTVGVIKFLPPKDLFKDIIPKNLFRKERQYGQYTERRITSAEYQNRTGDRRTDIKNVYAVTDSRTGEDYFVLQTN